MAIHKLKKGINLKLKGSPEQIIIDEPAIRKVALLGEDYIGMKPTMAVKEGDEVKLGQLLFTDKKIPAIRFTAPGAGKVVEINRGEKRAFQSLVIQLEGSAEITFNLYNRGDLDSLDKDSVVNQLLESGLWTSLRTRPFGKIADPGTVPHSIFITAMDTNPFAPDMSILGHNHKDHIIDGLKILSKLTDGKLFFCKSEKDNSPDPEHPRISIEKFAGPHPAGNPGTHIHILDPVNRNKVVWYLGLQDLIAISLLFTTGRIYTNRLISAGGAELTKQALFNTRIGAAVGDVLKGILSNEHETRIISGSVFSGKTANGPTAYLGRYDQQISVLREGKEREFLGWLNPGKNLASVLNVVISKFSPLAKIDLSTSLNGGRRSIVPIGSYEKVMPFDFVMTYLLRALAVNDVEEAEKLGCLELEEEDVALCTYVCPSKVDFGPILRRNLNLIEKEG